MNEEISNESLEEDEEKKKERMKAAVRPYLSETDANQSDLGEMTILSE